MRATASLGAAELEFHTGDYADASSTEERDKELGRLVVAAKTVQAESLSLVVAAGHGLTVDNVPALLEAAPEIVELNIGHAVVSDAVMIGFEAAVEAFLAVMKP